MSEYAERDAQALVCVLESLTATDALILSEVGELLFGESEFSVEDIPQKLRETLCRLEDECKELARQRDEALARSGALETELLRTSIPVDDFDRGEEATE